MNTWKVEAWPCHRRRSVRRVPLAFVAGVVILTSSGCGSAAPPHSRTTAVLPAGKRPAIGVAYHYKLFIHCGVLPLSFGGKNWRPVQPVPKYPGARAVNGVTTETGYVTGTMTLAGKHILRFTADPSTVLAPFTVAFSPTTSASTAQPCA